MGPKTLDHVAFWVEDRDGISEFATAHLGMHVIERTDRFTLIGSDARHGKLTLFAADGPREPGALKHVALRVTDLEQALARLPDDLAVDSVDGRAYFDVGERLRLGLVEAATDTEYDLDHVALSSAHPAETAAAYGRLGFAAEPPGRNGQPRVGVGGAYLEFHPGDPGEPERPLLNHLAVLVDSAEEHRLDAEELGVEIADVVDAANTLAVFVWGPERVKIEYVEHKPTFSLT
jgi:catechol 2,3-dioxygenase-like lactoylglutathione lyase family enzyme